MGDSLDIDGIIIINIIIINIYSIIYIYVIIEYNAYMYTSPCIIRYIYCTYTLSTLVVSYCIVNSVSGALESHSPVYK